MQMIKQLHFAPFFLDLIQGVPVRRVIFCGDDDFVLTP
jgi:hypothetical protein